MSMTYVIFLSFRFSLLTVYVNERILQMTTTKRIWFIKIKISKEDPLILGFLSYLCVIAFALFSLSLVHKLRIDIWSNTDFQLEWRFEWKEREKKN